MLRKMKLSIFCLLLVTLFAAQPCLAAELVNVSIEPNQIILNAEGNSAKGQSDKIQAIQASIPGTGMVKECDATLTIDGQSVTTDTFHYCAFDDILHIKFDREDVLAALEGKGTPEGVLYTADVSATIINPTGDSKDLEGSSEVKVIDPEKTEKKPE